MTQAISIFDNWPDYMKNKRRYMKRGAKRRKKDFEITKEYMIMLLESQGFRCAITGRLFTLENISHIGSIDRIDNLKGYIPGNIWFITQKENAKKADYSIEQIERKFPYMHEAILTFATQSRGEIIDILC